MTRAIRPRLQTSLARRGSAGQARPRAFDPGPSEPVGHLAVQLLTFVAATRQRPLVHVAPDERRTDELAGLLQTLDPELRLSLLPAWDCLPYDRVPPSRAVMGRRAAALRWLTDRRSPPDLLLTTPAALLQRVPPRTVWAKAHTEFRVGRAVDPEAARAHLERLGYIVDERVDEPGEVALRGAVIDIFPAAAPRPCRVEHEDGVITAIRSYDPRTQRSIVETELLELEPASEAIQFEEDGQIQAGQEHRLPDFYRRLDSVFDYLPKATTLVIEPGVEHAAQAFADIVADAHEGRVAIGRALADDAGAAIAPHRLYLTPEEWQTGLAGRTVVTIAPPSPGTEQRFGVPRFIREASSWRCYVGFVEQQLADGAKVVLAGPARRALDSLGRRTERALGHPVATAADWRGAAAGRGLAQLMVPLERGFRLPDQGVAVVAVGDVLGSRGNTSRVRTTAVAAEEDLRLGDTVVHAEHGLAVLEDLEEVAGVDGGRGEAVRLRFAGNGSRLVPVAEIGKLWRYGAEAEAVSLDRLGGDGWTRRRAQVEDELASTAERLVALAREREGRVAPRLTAPERDYDRFVARFPYALSADQAEAIRAVLADLASGQPMDRLVSGDVGFGKTEVALRAAAVALFAGTQVAVVVPTTVLARQHVETFTRRFAPFGIAVAALSRLSGAPEARGVKQGLANGSVRLVIGTHALAAKGARFADLGLVVIDEEHRFGAREKLGLRQLAESVHTLTLTATPIPRTLQSALVGLQDLSIIATPPVMRQPIRTVLAELDGAILRAALRREARRGGQSFVVCPRIEELAPMAERLGQLVPELTVISAHGRMPAEELDRAVVRFGAGFGDVLLATNIIESGLDMPRANTILVTGADRFGLAQLHQLRGRVGRGSRRGIAYFLTDPARRPTAATRRRLEAVAALDRPGAGLEISRRDLDLRGAGDLMGEQQAGHVRLIGIGLYQHLLAQAVVRARGDAAADGRSPEVRIGLGSLIPRDYVPDPNTRLEIYARLDRLAATGDVDALEEEIADRFGPLPPEVDQLLALVRLRLRCRELAIERLEAGPQGVAITFRTGADVPGAVDGAEWRGERLFQACDGIDPQMRAVHASELLDLIAAVA